MSNGDDRVEDLDEGELLPDEYEMIVERIESIEDTESHLTTEEVAENLGLDRE